jgi:hypothetical protein
MTAPFAWVFLRMPSVALISLLVIVSNVISTYGYQHQILYHYSVVALPALALGTVYALGAFQGRSRTAATAAVVVMALWTAHLWGPLPQSRNDVAYWTSDFPVAVDAQDIIRDVPDDAVVSAHYAITAHLARRRQIYSFPNPFYQVMYGNDIFMEGQPLPEADSVEYVVLPIARDEYLTERWSEVSSRFTLQRANGSWEIYRRSGG